MAVRAGREFLAIPGPTTMPDEVLRAMHRPALDIYSDQMVQSDRQPDARSVKIVRHQGQILHLHRQRPWRLGSRALQRAVARRQGAGAGKRPVCRRLGQRGGRAMGAEVEVLKGDWRRAVRPSRGRSPPAPGQGPQDQGDPGGAGRYRLRRLQRHRGDRQGDQAPRAIPRCSWSIRWLRSAACRSRWTAGASMSRCPARRRA